tara:strand:- start:25329 stop:25565 length:237 start_codon:yes stop_codon:yes gene_type:complete
MINKILFASIISLPIFFGSGHVHYNTKAVVTLVGAKIASQENSVIEKYKRKDCPVCKGKGWYISGDGIAKINCQYCEP